MSLIQNKFNNSLVTKWHITEVEDRDAIVHVARCIDRSGSLKLYGVFDSTRELISIMDEVEEPFKVTIKETDRSRKPGVLPMETKVSSETYHLGYCTCLCWHMEEFGILNNVEVFMSRHGLNMSYGTLANKLYSEKIYKSVLRLYKEPNSASLLGSLYTDNWAEVAHEIERRSEGLLDGPMDLSYISRAKSGAWCSWGLENETVIGLMLDLVKLGAVRHPTNVVYKCGNTNMLGRLAKGGRGQVRSGVFYTCGRGVSHRHKEGRVYMARNNARFASRDNADAFNPDIAPPSFKSKVDGLFHWERNGKKFSR